MATKTLNARVQNKRDTSANWTTNDPVLLNGEIILVDTNDGGLRFKIGDGVKRYTQLPFTDEPLRAMITDVEGEIPTTYAGSASAAGPATRSLAIPFGQVDSTSTATAFTATIDGITSLYDGVCVYLKNGVVSSASGWTLNVNNLGALPVYQTQAASTRVTTAFNVAYTALFVYNSSRVEGGCWDYFYGYNSDTNTTAYQTRAYQTLNTMYAALTRYKICFTRFDGTILPSTATSNSTATTKTLTTDSFDPHGLIYYYSTTTGVDAGASPGASYMWLQYPSIDLRYSFNSGSTLTAKEPVYIKCSPQSDGSFKLAGNDCIVQSLPSTADNYAYLYLGKAYSTYQISLDFNHPIYCYRGGKIHMYTSVESELDAIPTTTSDLINDSGFITSAALPSASTASPLVNGTAAAGSALAYSREDHVHPTDTSRAAASHTHAASDITSGLATVATSGSYNDLSNKPSIPSAITNDYSNDAKSGNLMLYSTGSASSTVTSTNTSGALVASSSSGTQTLTIGKAHYDEGSKGNLKLSNSTNSNYTTITPSGTGTITITLPASTGTLALTSNVPSAATTVPAMDGTAAIGSSEKYAKADHVHPTDTSRAAASHTHAASDITSGLATVATSGSYNDLDDKPAIPTVPTNVSAFTNDAGYLTSYTETDPTVPAWAKASSKPTYTASEVGALPSNTTYVSSVNGSSGAVTIAIPSNTSDLTNDSGFITDAALSNSDWNEDDTADLAHVLNRPAIRAGDGENSIIEGQIEQDEGAAIYTIYVSASGDLLTYTTEDTLPSASNIKNYGVYRDVADNAYAIITDIDTTNHTIELAGIAYTSSVTNKQGEIYYKYKYATGDSSHSEGELTFAGRQASHAEGKGSRSVGYYSHAEGYQSSAAGQDAHAEGYRTKAIGNYSHSEGSNTIANGLNSHAEGSNTIATGNHSHVQGKFNIEDTSNLYADIVGNGTADNARSNAYTLDWSGNGVYAGKVTVGAAPTNDMDVATKKYVDDNAGGSVTMRVWVASSQEVES